MKILIVLRKWKDDEGVGKTVRDIKENLEKQSHNVETLSREDDLKISSLSGSMNALREFIKVKDEKGNYDMIYTQDWSIAFPLLFPSRIFKKKHFCLFHDIQPGENSKIFQKIAGNILSRNLISKNEKLKDKFSKSILSRDGFSWIKKHKV